MFRLTAVMHVTSPPGKHPPYHLVSVNLVFGKQRQPSRCGFTTHLFVALGMFETPLLWLPCVGSVRLAATLTQVPALVTAMCLNCKDYLCYFQPP